MSKSKCAIPDDHNPISFLIDEAMRSEWRAQKTKRNDALRHRRAHLGLMRLATMAENDPELLAALGVLTWAIESEAY